jgi:hypothetical protein
VICALRLPVDFSAGLNLYVQEKYVELWRAAQGHDPES